MKALILVLIIVSLIQTTILSLDLVLIILICRAYIKADQKNLYLAFIFGLLISLLDIIPLGLLSIIYLMLVQATQTFSKYRLAGNILLIIPVSLAGLFTSQLIISLYLHQAIEFLKLLIEGILSLPIVYAVKLWEERFIIQKEFKLKI